MDVHLARMVMPRSRSRSLLSIACASTFWFSRKAPDCLSRASTRVVLPWSTCAMIAMLRIPIHCSLGAFRAFEGQGSAEGMLQRTYSTGRVAYSALARQRPRSAGLKQYCCHLASAAAAYLGIGNAGSSMFERGKDSRAGPVEVEIGLADGR